MKKQRWHKPNAKSKNKKLKLNFAVCSLNFKFALALVLVAALAVTLLPQPAYAAGGLSSKVGTFAANSGTGNQSVTGVGFMPKAVLFWITDQTSTGSSSNGRFGRGWTDGTNQGAAATGWDDGSDTVGGICVTDKTRHRGFRGDRES